MNTVKWGRSDPSGSLDQPLTLLKGIGEKRARLLAQKGLRTLLDLFHFLPIRYEDRTRIVPLGEVVEGRAQLVSGTVESGREERFYRRGKRLYRIRLRDETGCLDLLWFHYRKAHLHGLSRRGEILAAYGTVRFDRGRARMIHPDLEAVGPGESKNLTGIYPVYSAVSGIPARTLRAAVSEAIEQYLERLEDPVPQGVLEHLGLPGLAEAIRGVHQPPPGCAIERLNRLETPCHRRLTFDRFFYVLLNVAMRRHAGKGKRAAVLSAPPDFMERLKECLPFSLTRDQERAVREVSRDLVSGRLMSRLLQGDVGCGKTVVAEAAVYLSTLNGYQAAVMAPTQVLARQHYEDFVELSKAMGFRPVLLTGSLKPAERRRVLSRIREGECDVVIGTQAMIQTGVRFSRLGLAVIDEQHRFGVRERMLLDQKGRNPHLLVMTATPIPRTLAMTLYGDLNVSTIRTYPEERRPVKTELVDPGRKRAVYSAVREVLAGGFQAMVICPVIDDGDEGDLKSVLDMHSRLEALFSPSYRLGLIHGRLSGEEKDRVMERFRKGSVDLLVGTSVVEVGVHAPGATVMVVEDPERFGLTQLHQLRGRVGRGSAPGRCLLMRKRDLPEASLARLQVLVDSGDGFDIAEKDLRMRGQGELMGLRQAGSGELDLREVSRDPGLLQAAKELADAIVSRDPSFSLEEHRGLRAVVFGEAERMDDSSLDL